MYLLIFYTLTVSIFHNAPFVRLWWMQGMRLKGQLFRVAKSRDILLCCQQLGKFSIERASELLMWLDGCHT